MGSRHGLHGESLWALWVLSPIPPDLPAICMTRSVFARLPSGMHLRESSGWIDVKQLALQ